MTSHLLIQEYERRVCKESAERIKTCLALLNNESVWYKPSACTNSIGNLIMHICGNARQWIFSVCEQPVNRNRPYEFSANAVYTKNELLALVENTCLETHKALQKCTEEMLTKTYTIQSFHVSGFSAIVHVIEHASYHTGQITLLTKLLTDTDTNYYKDHTL